MFFIPADTEETEGTRNYREQGDHGEMSGGKPSKAWEPMSKDIKLPEEDWAVLESVYNDYRFREGDLQRTEFIKRMMTKGIASYLVQLRSRTPEALFRIAQASSSLRSKS